MLSGMKTFTVSTKPNDKGVAKQTAITFDLNGCSEEVAIALAISAAIIKRQTSWRKHGIPHAETVKLADLAPGRRIAAAPREMTAQEVADRARNDAAYRAEVLAALEVDEVETVEITVPAE